MSAEIPAGGTWFDTLKGRSFEDVPIVDGNISTEEFIRAAKSLVTLFDVIGGTGLSFVKSDMTGNIDKVEKRFQEAPAESQTLQDLVNNEPGKKPASEGLLWLVRGLEFTAKALRHNLDNSSAELKTSFNDAYEGSLKPHHNWFAKKAFGLAVGAVPTREKFYELLGGKQEQISGPMEQEVAALEKVVSILKDFKPLQELK
ncbi:hypothetical protein N7532_002058 [Penicillium argentinense]|uniref:Glycolipid transfer protein domain-containing protein n=1 Tax=Penicillium argentinense TaxID=1131581 RepID=A0A9W9KN11_9EURO|nr:uncharacterized protein N7532_002058 [Penicillium argentinense]KAJ5111523.1 hypothetical protein N7532_002058 [Penicillium argentinense]